MPACRTSRSRGARFRRLLILEGLDDRVLPRATRLFPMCFWSLCCRLFHHQSASWGDPPPGLTPHQVLSGTSPFIARSLMLVALIYLYLSPGVTSWRCFIHACRHTDDIPLIFRLSSPPVPSRCPCFRSTLPARSHVKHPPPVLVLAAILLRKGCYGVLRFSLPLHRCRPRT